MRIPTPRAQGYAIMKMCSEFSKLGFKVELFVPDRKNMEKDNNPFDFYKIENNFNIKKIPSFDFLGKTLKFGRVFYWIDILSFLVASKFKIKINKNDILYTRDYLTLLFFSKKNFIIFEVHNIPVADFLFKRVIKKPRLFFVLNNNLKKELINRGVSSEKIFISPSGVDIKKFDIDLSKDEAREKLGLPLEKEIVLYSGQLYSWKGADTLAEAAKLLPEVAFVFIGGVRPEFDQFKEKYSSKNIIIRPFQKREIVPIYLKSADVLVVPNSGKEKIGASYTSPLKLFEYMASKRPIVASNLPSIREAVNKDVCFFAEADNPESFVEVIKKVLSDKEFSLKTIEKAFEYVQKFSWEIRVQNIVKEIKNKII